MLKFYRSVLAAGVVTLGLAACGDNVTVAPPPPPPTAGVTSVTVTPANASVGIGQTIQLAASVVADSGVSTGLDWTTSNALIATVSSTGLVTGAGLGTTTVIATSQANHARSSAVSITVTSSSVFNISPANMSLAPGQTSNATATISLSAGQTASNIVWTSLSPTIATVSGTCSTSAGTSVCPVTGVAQGSAVIQATTTVAGQTFVQTISVSVGAGASLSIQSVTEGATAGDTLTPGITCAGVVNAPVILTNVNCQIDVNLNFSPGIQRIDSITVWFQQGAITRKLARQFYGATVPAGGLVTLSVNTANFTKNPALGTTTVDLFNGPTTLIAQVWPTVGSGGSAIDCQIGGGNANPTCSNLSMILNNLDGWAGDVTKCSGVIAVGVVCPAANPAGPTPTGGFATDVGGSTANLGKTYWGGPGATGEITAELYAVVYDDNPGSAPGSSLNRCNNQLGDGTGCVSQVSWTIGSTSISTGHCDFPVPPQSATITPATPLFMQTFGSTGAPGLTNDCSGHQNILTRRDNIIFTSPTLDAQNNGYPTGRLIPNTVVFAATPDSFRLDWAPPTGVAQPLVIGAEGFNWINATFVFNPGGTLGTDAGVGPAPATWLAFASTSGGSGPFLTPITTGADLPETNQNCAGVGCDGFTAVATLADLLGNTATTGTTFAFGVDKTAPMVRYSTKAAPSSYAAIYDSGGTAAVHDSTTYWVIEGTYGANVVTAGAQVRFLAGAAGTNDSFRIEALDNRSGLSRAVENTINFSQVGTPCGTAGGCTTVSSITTGVFGASTIDGWRPAPAFHVTNGIVGGAPPATPGYYTTTGFVVDRAGNVSGCPSTGAIAGASTGTASICTAAPPSVTPGTNTATGVVGANEYFRRTLALDPAEPQVTGVSPNNNYTGNSTQTFTLGAQNDLEVIDALLSIQYPNVTIGDAAGTLSAGGGMVNFGSFSTVATRFDASIINPLLSQITLDMFTLNIQETCTGGAGGIGRPATGPAGTTCAASFAAGDPILATDIPFTKPNNVAVQVRDVFGSFISNTTAGATTGVSALFVSPILAATVAAPGGFSVTYDGSVLCPQGGVVGGACVTGGVNFRADGITGSTYSYRAVEPLSVTLPIFTRVDLFGLNAANQWIFIQRCTVPATIIPNTGAQGCVGGTVNGTDNGLERYWVYAFTSVPGGFTEYRALGVDSNGFGLFSTVQP